MKKTFPVFYQVYQRPYGFFREEKAREWAEATEGDWERFLKARGEWKNGMTRFFCGKPYSSITPTLTVKLEVCSIRAFGELRFAGYAEFRPGHQRVGWALQGQVIATLRAGVYSEEWCSKSFGWREGSPQSIEVTEEQVIGWASSVLKEWERRAQEDLRVNKESSW